MTRSPEKMGFREKFFGNECFRGTFFNIFYIWSNFDNFAGTLMTKNHRSTNNKISNGTTFLSDTVNSFEKIMRISDIPSSVHHYHRCQHFAFQVIPLKDRQVLVRRCPLRESGVTSILWFLDWKRFLKKYEEMKIETLPFSVSYQTKIIDFMKNKSNVFVE